VHEERIDREGIRIGLLLEGLEFVRHPGKGSQAFGVHGERKSGSGCVEFASRMSWKVRLGEIGHGNGRTRQNQEESCECRDPVCRSVRSLACWLHWAAIPDAIGFIPCSIPDWRASYDAAGCRIPGWLWNAI
jgi:hypothetical protein